MGKRQAPPALGSGEHVVYDTDQGGAAQDRLEAGCIQFAAT